LNEIGEEELRRRIYADPAASEELPPVRSFNEVLAPAAGNPDSRIEACFFAGQLSAAELKQLADFADKWSNGILMVTVDQNIAFQLSADSNITEARQVLQKTGFISTEPADQVTFRVCPGTHECKMGLAATREVVTAIMDSLGPKVLGKNWAISGCPNSCTQTQLADFGISTSKLVAGDDGQRSPRFDIFRGQADGLGQRAETGLTLEELIAGLRLRSANDQ